MNKELFIKELKSFFGDLIGNCRTKKESQLKEEKLINWYDFNRSFFGQTSSELPHEPERRRRYGSDSHRSVHAPSSET